MDIVVDRFQSGIRYRARGTVCPSSPPPPWSHRPPLPSSRRELQAKTAERLVEAKRLEQTAKMLPLEWDATLDAGEIWPGNAHRLPRRGTCNRNVLNLREKRAAFYPWPICCAGGNKNGYPYLQKTEPRPPPPR